MTAKFGAGARASDGFADAKAPAVLRRLLKDIARPAVGGATQCRFALGNGVVLLLSLLEFESRPQIGKPIGLRVACRNIGIATSPAARVQLCWNIAEGQRENEVARQEVMEVPPLEPVAEIILSGAVAAPINRSLDVRVGLGLETADAKPWQREGPPIVIRRRLSGGSAGADFDYRDAYAKADLERDWWSIVGPATLEEYVAQGRRKLAQLQRLGLRADARFLDIGCGTGQLTEQLAVALSPAGCYVGTDIAEEAVAFCRCRFPHPNFRFVRNEATQLPIEGEVFDIVYLASVFTHMELHEIRGMLTEIQRLLATGGWGLADAFVSTMVAHQEGNHSMMILNEAALQVAFAAQGFTWRETGSAPWNAQCRRVVYRFWR